MEENSLLRAHGISLPTVIWQTLICPAAQLRSFYPTGLSQTLTHVKQFEMSHRLPAPRGEPGQIDEQLDSIRQPRRHTIAARQQESLSRRPWNRVRTGLRRRGHKKRSARSALWSPLSSMISTMWPKGSGPRGFTPSFRSAERTFTLRIDQESQPQTAVGGA